MGTDAAIDIAARISGATTDIATRVTGAIRDAARATGAGFEYLLNTAMRESNLNPNAKAKTSSATGLFQFIDQTWLGTMKQSGAALGYGKYADAITQDAVRAATSVSDPAMRQRDHGAAQGPDRERRDGGRVRQFQRQGADRPARPQADRRRTLHGAFPRRVRRGALHQRSRSATRTRRPRTLFPRAAHANTSIFYDKQGGARSLKQVYAGLVDAARRDRHARASPPRSRPPKPRPTSASRAAPRAAARPAACRGAPSADRRRPRLHAGARQRDRAITPRAGDRGGDRDADCRAPRRAVAPASPHADRARRTAPLREPAAQPLFQSLYQPEQRGAGRAGRARAVGRAPRGARSRQPAAVAPADGYVRAGAAAQAVNAPLDLFRSCGRPRAAGVALRLVRRPPISRARPLRIRQQSQRVMVNLC